MTLTAKQDAVELLKVRAWEAEQSAAENDAAGAYDGADHLREAAAWLREAASYLDGLAEPGA